jgi:uncharacterized repeat protein (TIGR01451 family)
MSRQSQSNRKRNARQARFVLPLALVALVAAGALYFGTSLGTAAQDDRPLKPSDAALRQMDALVREKESRTPEQQKLDSQLLLKVKQQRGDELPAELRTMNVPVASDADGTVLVDIKTQVTPGLLDAIKANLGEVVSSYAEFDAVRARLPLRSLEAIAALREVRFIGPAEEPMSAREAAKTRAPFVRRLSREARAANVRAQLARTLPIVASRKASGEANPFSLNSARLNPLARFIGALDSEGDFAHRADQLRALGINGAGIRIGVISDSERFLAASQATNDLPAGVTVVASGIAVNDTGEGTAMMEIIHDLAPQAQLFFATGNGGQATMAANINLLAGAPNNCDIIVDDLTYFAEPVFQDGVIARAVNDVAAAGVLYLSSAGNSGNLNDGQSGVWEGDFADGGTLALVGAGRIHDFGGGTTFNRIVSTGGNNRPITLKWSDPLGASGNDYDLFILNPAMTAVVASSTNVQNGNDDPIESLGTNGINANDRIVILRRNGSAVRALHLNTNRGRLAIGTAGQTYGHNAAAGAVTLAQVDVRAAGAQRFDSGVVTQVRTTSSDGPRRMFFDRNGNALTPGNVLFATNGGQVLQKPDLAAAACGVTTVPGFNPFCGTSAAAPHAAAIAGLLLSFNTALTPAQLRTALGAGAFDIEAAGVDRDSGAGIAMALHSLAAVSQGDLAITKTDSPDPVTAGTNLTYTINVQNNGAGPAVFARMSDPLPSGVTFQSMPPPPAGWTCTTGATVTCTKDTMAVNESASFTIVVRVNASVPDGTLLTNTATVGATSTDPNNSNNSATATTAVVAKADLEVISKVDTPDPVITNNPLRYTITVRNNGPSVAANVVLADPLPAGALFGACASTGAGVCGGASQNRTVNFATLAVGQTEVVILDTTANCSLADGAVINNIATLTAATQDPDPTNNSQSASTVAQNPPPVIACPADFDVIATTPGSTTATVNFADPMVTDNCPGAVVVCSPASGSAFALGTTTVNCTATDSGGAMASCSFNVTVWDASIQDEESRDYILFNTFTGDYKFVVCGVSGFVMTGQGVITREGCITKLRDDTRVIGAQFDRCHIAPRNSGSATMKRRQPDISFILNDRNILNNSPTCP